MVDKNTFGRTPAAIFLAARLIITKDNKLARKVSTVIQKYRRTMHEVISGYDCGALSHQTVSTIMTMLKDNLANTVTGLKSDNAEYDDFEPPCHLTVDLMANVLYGEIKEILSRTKATKHLLKQQQRAGFSSLVTSRRITNSSGEFIGSEETRTRPYRPDLMIEGNITPKTLQQKSREKLARKNKPCNFY